MKKWQSIGLLFFLLLSSVFVYSVEVISIDENYTTRNITAESGYLQLQNCDTVFFSRAFHPISRNHFSVSSLASCILIEVRLSNDCQEEQEMTLELVNPYLYNVKYSLGAADGAIDQKSLKTLNHKSTLHPSVDFNVAAGESEVLYLLIPIQYHSTFFNIYLSKKKSFLQADFTNTFLVNGVIGGLFTYLLIILTLALVSRNKLLLRYAFIDLWVLLFIWVDSGLASIIWFGGAPLAQNLLLLVIGLGYLGSIIYFIRAFFDLYQKHRKIAFFLNALFFILFLLAVFAFYTEQESSFLVIKRKVLIHIVNGVLLITLLTFYYLGFSNYKKTKRREVLWFLGAFVLHIITWFFVLSYKGYFNARLSILDDLPFHLARFYGNVPFVAFVLLFVEMLTVSYFIVLGFKSVVDEYSISLEKMKIQEASYLSGMLNGQELERIKVERTLEDKILKRINDIDHELKALAILENDQGDSSILATEIEDVSSIKKLLTDVANDFVQTELLEKKFNEAIEQIFNKTFSSQHGIDVRLQCDLLNDNLPKEFRNNIFRITQEILNNIIKHSEATEVTADFYEEDGFFKMSIIDNGIGSNIGKEQINGIGIKTILTRVESMQGTIHFENIKTKGFGINIEIPID